MPRNRTAVGKVERAPPEQRPPRAIQTPGPRAPRPPRGGAGPQRRSLLPAYAPKAAVPAVRGFAFDPSLATTLETAGISEVVFKVPWEPLEPGPVGEYLEVVDFDPASECFYEPVDLDDPHLLAQDGLPPTEGTRSSTSRWSTRSPADDRELRARPGPHGALAARPVARRRGNPSDDRTSSSGCASTRTRCARPTPTTARQEGPAVRLLPAVGDDPGEHLPGGMVFTCLSHDIVAHETTHALLDGMHRRFLEPTQPGRAAPSTRRSPTSWRCSSTSPSPRSLRPPDRRARAATSAAGDLLGAAGPAVRPGDRQARRAARRDRRGRSETASGSRTEPDPDEYEQPIEPHDRGAILVAAVFDAFLAIYKRRVADLLRLATGGTGVLPPGRHPPRPGQPAGRRGGQVGPARADDVHPRPGLLPAGGHHLRRVPARAHHRRLRPRARRRPAATASPSSRRSAAAASTRAASARCRVDSLLLAPPGDAETAAAPSADRGQLAALRAALRPGRHVHRRRIARGRLRTCSGTLRRAAARSAAAEHFRKHADGRPAATRRSCGLDPGTVVRGPHGPPRLSRDDPDGGVAPAARRAAAARRTRPVDPGRPGAGP